MRLLVTSGRPFLSNGEVVRWPSASGLQTRSSPGYQVLSRLAAADSSEAPGGLSLIDEALAISGMDAGFC